MSGHGWPPRVRPCAPCARPHLQGSVWSRSLRWLQPCARGRRRGGGKEACGGAWAPGVRERVWGWGVWPNQGLCSWTPHTLGVGGGTGGHRTPPGPKKLWQDWAGLPHRPLPLPQGILAPLLGRTLPEPTFLGAHFPPPLPHQYPLPRTWNLHGKRPLFFSDR